MLVVLELGVEALDGSERDALRFDGVDSGRRLAHPNAAWKSCAVTATIEKRHGKDGIR